ncbi:hypothetical protein [Streptomyces bacillaris]|uniref:hypothetical protein n=1 Tax=Streptomyces bacillaris TaxID=68179 RepID=UPI00370002D2
MTQLHHQFNLSTPNVRSIAANPGDWGIDAFAGNLGGAITVWQSKYFMHVTTKKPVQQVEDSLDSVLKAAAKNGHTIASWILCIPSNMDGPMTAWWDTWTRAKEKEHGLVIQLWDETALRKKLLIAANTIGSFGPVGRVRVRS